jgi:HD-like signal output (HDOD) protein/CheY-like chemotaxis protein
MANKRILIAHADPHTLAEYGRALGKEWTVKLVTGQDAALAEMAAQPFDVLVADCALARVNDGVELLDRIHTEHPKTIRILLAGEMDKEHRMADVEGSHLILTKPCDNATLRNAIQRALAIDLWLTNDSLRELVARLRTFPIVPSLYLEVINALKSPNTTTSELGAIIAKDMAMMTKLLQVTNSACFGLPRKISDPEEAVGILGFETVKSMVMTLKLLSQYDKVKPVYFSIDRLWRHSTEVARISRRLALTQSDDPVLAESAFTAGLMHDLGKLVLASNFDEQYSGAQALARQQQLPLWQVEKQIFGASHGEIGAYLLGLWGMPLDLVEAAALHHNPSRCLAKRFSPLTAVHVANVLVYEAKPDKEGFVPPQIDETYIAELGLSEQLLRWRELVLTQDLEVTQFRTRSGETVIAKKPVAAAAKPAPRPTRAAPYPAKPAPAPARSAPASIFTLPQHRWVYAGTLVVLFILTFWLGAQTLVRMVLAPAAPPDRAMAAKRPLPAPAPAVVAVAPPASTPVPLPVQPPAKAVETPAPAAAPVAAAATAPPPPSAKELAFAELRLQSIFYSQSNPSAVISGKRVRPRDRLPAGATVLAISPSSVTLEFENERKILALK